MARPLRFALISWGRLDQHEQPSKGPQPNATWESGQWIDCEESLGQVGADGSIGSVSYTHLTLPTIYSV